MKVKDGASLRRTLYLVGAALKDEKRPIGSPLRTPKDQRYNSQVFEMVDGNCTGG